jgi:hypothetical protein
MSSIYILKSGSSCEDVYKVGICSNGKNKLISRYLTYIPDVLVHFYYDTHNAKQIEKNIKSTFKDFRIPNSNNLSSEWFNLPLETLIDCINMLDSYFKKIQHIKANNNITNIDYDFLIDKENFIIHDFLFHPEVPEKIKLLISKIFLHEDNYYVNKFYNILSENNEISQKNRNKILKFSYRNLYTDRAAKLEVIKWLNSLLGINHSTETKLIEKQHLVDIFPILLQNKQQIYDLFRIEDKTIGKGTEATKTVIMLNKVYGVWCGSKLKRKEHQRRIMVTDEITGIKTKEDVTPFDFGFKIKDEYIDLHEHIRGFKRKECQMTIENKEEVNEFFSMNNDSPITPVLNIISPTTPISPLEGQIVPVFNIMSPTATTTTIETTATTETTAFNIISPLKESIKQQNVSPVFNILQT